MDEVTLQWIMGAKLIWLAVYATMWGMGGISGKWKRRVAGAIWLSGGYVLFGSVLSGLSFSYLLCAPLLFGASSLGYGADELITKIKRRSISGLALATASLPVFIINQAWLLLAVHFVVCTGLMVILGVWNPFRSARAEETTIGVGAGFIPLMTV